MSTYAQIYKRVFIPENQQEITIKGKSGNSYKFKPQSLNENISFIKNFEVLQHILIYNMGYDGAELELNRDEVAYILDELNDTINMIEIDEYQIEMSKKFIEEMNAHLENDLSITDIDILYCFNIN